MNARHNLAGTEGGTPGFIYCRWAMQLTFAAGRCIGKLSSTKEERELLEESAPNCPPRGRSQIMGVRAFLTQLHVELRQLLHAKFSIHLLVEMCKVLAIQTSRVLHVEVSWGLQSGFSRVLHVGMSTFLNADNSRALHVESFRALHTEMYRVLHATSAWVILHSDHYLGMSKNRLKKWTSNHLRLRRTRLT